MTTARPSLPRSTGGPRRLRAWARGLLAGPVAFLASWVLMAGAALYLPRGAAGIDNLVFPIILFPLIWALLFLYTLTDPRLLRASAVLALVLLTHGGLIAYHLGAAT